MIRQGRGRRPPPASLGRRHTIDITPPPQVGTTQPTPQTPTAANLCRKMQMRIGALNSDSATIWLTWSHADRRPQIPARTRARTTAQRLWTLVHTIRRPMTGADGAKPLPGCTRCCRRMGSSAHGFRGHMGSRAWMSRHIGSTKQEGDRKRQEEHNAGITGAPGLPMPTPQESPQRSRHDPVVPYVIPVNAAPPASATATMPRRRSPSGHRPHSQASQPAIRIAPAPVTQQSRSWPHPSHPSG